MSEVLVLNITVQNLLTDILSHTDTFVVCLIVFESSIRSQQVTESFY